MRFFFLALVALAGDPGPAAVAAAHPAAPAAGPRICSRAPLPALHERLPWGPGERLSFDMAFLGVRTARVQLRIGQRTSAGGVDILPLRAEARSERFMEIFDRFDARMVSLLDAATLLPVRMSNHLVAFEPFVAQPVDSLEKGDFAHGAVDGSFRRKAPDGSMDAQVTLASASHVLDVLSIIYYLRTRQLDEGTPFCFEVYHRLHLWRVEGKVGPVEEVSTPATTRRAVRLDAVVTRMVGDDAVDGDDDPPPPRTVQVWISDDADRFPLRVVTPESIGELDVQLSSFERGLSLAPAP